jgi:hypothetical protein
MILPYFNLPVDRHVVKLYLPNLHVWVIKQFGLEGNMCEFIWDIPDLNLCQVTLYHDQTFTGFPQPLQVDAKTLHWKSTWPLPSILYCFQNIIT